MRAVFYIACLEVKRMMKNHMTWFVLITSIFLLFLMERFNYFTIEEQLKMIKDFSLGIMNIISLLLVIYYPVNMIKEDFSSKTIFPLLSSPVNRSSLLLGKAFSLFILIGVTLFLNAFSLWIMLLSKGGGFSSSLLIAVLMIYLKNLTLIGFAFLFGLLPLSELLAIVLTFFIYALGSVKTYFIETINEDVSVVVLTVQKLIFSVIPNLRIYDVVENITLGESITYNHLMYCFFHFLGISILSYGFAFFLFNRKEI